MHLSNFSSITEHKSFHFLHQIYCNTLSSCLSKRSGILKRRSSLRWLLPSAHQEKFAFLANIALRLNHKRKKKTPSTYENIINHRKSVVRSTKTTIGHPYWERHFLRFGVTLISMFYFLRHLAMFSMVRQWWPRSFTTPHLSSLKSITTKCGN